MHHPVSGNQLADSPVTSRLASQLVFVIINTRHPSLQAQNLPFQQILPTLIYPGLPSRSPDRAYHASPFILVRFPLIFLFLLCGGLSWYTRQLFTTR